MADDELCGGARRNFIRIRASFVDSINFIRPHSLSLSLSFLLVLAIKERRGKKGKTQKVERRVTELTWKKKEGRTWRRKVDDRSGILSGKWTARIPDRREWFRFHLRQGSHFSRWTGRKGTFQFNFCTTHRGKVLYLDIGLREFSSRFPYPIPRSGKETERFVREFFATRKNKDLIRLRSI